MTKSSTVFRYGKALFRVTANSPNLFSTIDCMEELIGSKSQYTLANIPGNYESITVIQLDEPYILNCRAEMNESDFIGTCASYILSKIYHAHDDCTWMDAAVVCSPLDKLVLLSGKSFAGKTTLALSIALSRSWRLLSEDITLVDLATSTVLSCPGPSGLRPKTMELLQRVGNPRSTAGPKWGLYFDEELFRTQVCGSFAAAVYLEPIAGEAESFIVKPITQNQLIKRLLPISNLLKSSATIDQFQAMIANASCLELSGGTIEERIQLVEELSTESNKPAGMAL